MRHPSRFIQIHRFVTDSLLGPVWRHGPTSSVPRLYLTFDDGPEPECTSRVLDILQRHGVKATFFVVVETAQKYPDFIRRALADGHAIGNHSLDHRYRRFFAFNKRMTDWISESQRQFTELLGTAPIGWRSPSGVRTPHLQTAIHRLGLPLVHWNVRFFDTCRAFTIDRARRSLDRTPPDSIVLLHDRHRGQRADTFIKTLDWYVGEAKRRGFILESLPALPCATMR